MHEVMMPLIESGIITIVSVLFISTWAYRCGRASRQAEINELKEFLEYYMEITKVVNKHQGE
jgi:hypothetical protein